MVLDVRFLPNPHWVPELRPLPGTDENVRRYVQDQDAYGDFVDRLRELLDVAVPGYVAEGKSYLTVAIGCTGGRHRSVVVARGARLVLPGPGLPAASSIATWTAADARRPRSRPRPGRSGGPVDSMALPHPEEDSHGRSA